MKVSLVAPSLAGPKFLAVLPVNCGVTAVSPIFDVQLYYCGVVNMRCLAFEPALRANNIREGQREKLLAQSINEIYRI